MRILVVVNADNPKAHEASMTLKAFLDSQGVESVIFASSELPPFAPPAGVNWPSGLGRDSRFDTPFDMAVVLGGDGTIIRTARMVASEGTPIMGLNFGHLGFLADSGEAGIVQSVAAALAGEVSVEKRTNLRIDVFCDDECESSGGALDCSNCTFEACRRISHDVDQEKPLRSFFALNEISIARALSGLIVDFDLAIHDEKVASLRADGVVVSSPTGSTAYALSAGGPLISPRHRGLVVVPLNPHTLSSRAIVTTEHDVVEIYFPDTANRSDIAIFSDGSRLPLDSPVRRVLIRCGDVYTTILRYQGSSFYRKASDVFFGNSKLC